MTSHNPTALKILEIAREMVMTRGYHAFSFRDISAQAGIKPASIHYHFPTKADLCSALLMQVEMEFHAELDAILKRQMTPSERLSAFAQIFQQTFGDGKRLCLVCMLAASQDTLPEMIRQQVSSFWQAAVCWLEQQISEGKQQGEIHAHTDSHIAAQTLLSTLEGAMLTARSIEDTQQLSNSANFLLSSLQVKQRMQPR